MKKVFLAIATFALAFSCVGCEKKTDQEEENSNRLHFAQLEYQIHSGDSVTISQKLSGITYSFAGEVPENVRLNSTNGTIYFDASVPNFSQVLLVANSDDKQSDPAIITLLQNAVTTDLSFHTPVKNIIDGDYILVTSTNNTAITYSLKNPVTGVSIDSMTGRVSYTSAAVEGTSFTVVASSADKSIEDNYKVTVSNLAVATTKSQTIEIGSEIPATYVLDFSNTPAGTEEAVLAVMNGTKKALDTEFTYNPSTHALVIASSFLSSFKTGENKIKIITARNIITAELVMATKFIRNAHDLQSINKDRESLAGYYVLENDIDLTDYLSYGGEGYNDNRGWNQIGIYHDLEADPTRDSFTGTFDGNGHIISGYFENRADDLAHNEGLFGYVTNQGLIKNVGFVGTSKKTTGRNFIGGFVGFNEGTIRNCWSNVNISNKHEDKLFHSIGAFAGANTGIIDGCYTLGLPEGDTLVGAFVGKNYGEISNCFSLNASNSHFYATQITGSTTNCHVFATEAAMKAFDYASCLDSSIWKFTENNLPSLKNNTTFDHVNGIEITNREKEVTQGDVVDVGIVIHPNSLQETYKNQVVYTVENIESTGIIQTGNKFNTDGATVDKFTVTASIHTEFGDFASSHEFKINDKIESIEWDPGDTWPIYVEPGKQYEMKVKVTPEGADAGMTWEVLGTKYGAAGYSFFEGNILTLKEEIMNYHSKEANPTFDIRGTAKNGMTLDKTLTLTRIHYLGTKWSKPTDGEEITTGCLNFYKDTTAQYIEFKLPHSADLGNYKVYKYSKQINVTRSGYTIRIPISHIKELPNREIPFTFKCGGGASQLIFKGYACYIDRNPWTMSDVPTTYIPLSSAEDFYTYFRMKLDDNHPEKYANYDKTYVLTNDIDFGGADNLVSIGYESSTYPEAKAFSGKIYGFGHKIRNATFHYGERYYYAGPTTDPAKANRDPNTNNVGFFGFFRGEVYDVIFEGVQSLSYNYGGLFAGRILAGVLENVIMTDCKSMCTYTECDYTIDDLYTGRVAGISAGRFTGVTYNGTTVGLVGK